MTAITLQIEDSLASRLVKKAKGMNLQSYIMQLLQFHATENASKDIPAIQISPFIKSLQLHGDLVVPADADAIDAIVTEKFFKK